MHIKLLDLKLEFELPHEQQVPVIILIFDS